MPAPAARARILLARRALCARSITFDFSVFGAPPTALFIVHDVWLHEPIGQFQGNVTLPVPPHGTRMFVLHLLH